MPDCDYGPSELSCRKVEKTLPTGEVVRVAICGLILFFVARFADATEWSPPEKFLQAVCMVESSNGQYLYGDEGRSLGHFQLSEGAWLDVNEWRKARSLKTYSYQSHVYNPYINRVYAGNYITLIHAQLSRKLRREPSHSEVYAAYNMGLACFAQCNYNLNRVNSLTLAKCRQINELMASQ